MTHLNVFFFGPFYIRIVLLFILTGVAFSMVQAQERCATVLYNKQLHDQKKVLENQQQFENWIQNKIENRKLPLSTSRTKSTYQIPVVVHIIHNGEAIGNGVNISDAQIQSQISVLNKDFQRLNTDAPNTLPEFLPVAGSIDLEFVLAKRTPEGLPTNGIVRVQGNKSQWLVADNYELKALSYWPAEDYFNIWVTDIGQSYLGFAQFPVSNLSGMENSPDNRLTDGIVIDYTVFGSDDDGPFILDNLYNKGRTVTHETGHYLGLLHVWGSNDKSASTCSGTDYVNDTPNQSGPTYGCPTGSQSSCSTNKMYQNFLDYTNDACMNLFSQGQMDRIIAVLENSPRRYTLLESPGLEDPVPIAIDLGIKEVISPTEILCETSVTPAVQVTNYGTNTITSASIRLLQNGTLVETINPVLNLAPSASTTLNFNTVVGLTPGLPYTFTIEILQVNGGTDGNDTNDSLTVSSKVSFFKSVPFSEELNTTPGNWTVINQDQLITWQNVIAPNANPSNRALFMDFYNYEDNEGEADIFLSPVLDLSAVPSAYLSFSVAYAPFPGSSDGLRVYVLSDCNNNLFQGTKVYDKFGSNLQTTAAPTAVAFTPVAANQWRTEIVNLTAFAGQDKIQLAFIGVNGYGNNLYLDKISVITEADENVSLREVVSPTPVSCNNSIRPAVIMRNESTVTINSVKVSLSINGDVAENFLFNNIDIGPNEEDTLTLEQEQTLNDGLNTLLFDLIEPNGLIDSDPSDNIKMVRTYISKDTSPIPLRQNFDNNAEGWTVINPSGDEIWEPVTTNYDQSLYFNAFDNAALGDEAWLVTPVLDFSLTQSASVYFDVSYAYNENRFDQLKILGSIDCGNSYTYELYNQSGENLSVANSNSSWQPQTESDWRRDSLLNILSGEPEARLAFVFTNANGNNLFLDNIQFYASDEIPFLIYDTDPSGPDDFSITFNLDQLSQVEYEVIDMMGRQLVSVVLSDVLKQNFTIDAGNVSPGIYIVRLKIGSDYYAERIYLKGQ